MFFKKKKNKKEEKINIEEGKILVDEKEFIDLKEQLLGYYNMMTLFENSGIVTNDIYDTVKINLSLLYRNKL